MITVVNNMEMRRLKNANGEKSSEELRQEVIAEYAR